MQPKNLSDRLFFDIETTAHPRADEFLGLEPFTVGELTVPELKSILVLSDLSTSGNKDELVERVVSRPASDHLMEMLREHEQERNAEALDKAPLDPDLGAIRAIGWASGDGIIEVRVVPQTGEDIDAALKEGKLPSLLKVKDNSYGVNAIYWGGDESERDMINEFWDVAEKHRLQLVGANILNFDLPFLLRRSMELNIRVPKDLSLRRYQVEPICDTMQILSHWGAFKYKSLKFMCKRYGIEIPMPDVDGSQVKDMDSPTLARYVASDVFCTRELWKKMDGVYWPEAVQFPNPHAG